MLPVGFEIAIPASQRPQTYTLDNTVIGIGKFFTLYQEYPIANQILGHMTVEEREMSSVKTADF